MCVPYASYVFYALYRSRFSERSDIVFACTDHLYPLQQLEVAVVSTPDKCSSERRDLDLALTFFMMENSNASKIFDSQPLGCVICSNHIDYNLIILYLKGTSLLTLTPSPLSPLW